ncbi:hypothetical protein U9M48_000818 [Paspalum notatum var. saurae]|uniref:Uncharacterized protein n=1 Tax=Paspalum notatum var. saurae TaxID=547442 RepID=A0AAQ3PN58_PASNO
MASSKSKPKPMTSSSPAAVLVLLFLAMTAVMLAPCTTQAQTSPGPAPAPSQSACPPGFKNMVDLTDFLRGTGRELITTVDPALLPPIKDIIGIIPHTGLKLCVCFNVTASPSPPLGVDTTDDIQIQCVEY